MVKKYPNQTRNDEILAILTRDPGVDLNATYNMTSTKMSNHNHSEAGSREKVGGIIGIHYTQGVVTNIYWSKIFPCLIKKCTSIRICHSHKFFMLYAQSVNGFCI